MNAAEPQQVAEAKAVAKRRALEDVLTMREILATPRGRRWMWDLLSAAHLFHEDMDTDPGHMAFRKGERNFALRLYSAVTRNCPAEYIAMIRENTNADIPEPQQDQDNA